MSPTAFAHPEWAAVLAAVVAAATLAVLLARQRARRRSARLFPGGPPPHLRGLAGDAALVAALLAISVALVGPRIGTRTVAFPSAGVDVVFLVDVSRSMDAADIPPSRLDRARRAVEELLARLAPSDRAALAAFAGNGALLTPLTPDHDALRALLDGLDSDLFRPAGSRLAAGVAASIDAFEEGSSRPRVLFVLSDGEDPKRRGRLGAALAVPQGIRVVTAAIGSDAGGPVVVDGTQLRDAGGRPVVTRRDAERLASLAEATGGQAFAGDEWGRFDFEAATAAIRRDVSAHPGEPVARRVRAVRVAPFAALAFGLLLLEGLPRPRRLPRAAWAAGGAIALMLTAAGGIGDPAAARARSAGRPQAENGGDPRALIALGLAELENGRPGAAIRAFRAAAVYSRQPDVAAVAHYDLGVAALAADDPATARDAFFEAVALDGSDREARFNLEWSLALLERETPASPPPPPAKDTGSPAPDAEPADVGDPSPPASAGRPVEPGERDLTPEQRRRLLQRVTDDPSHWLRAAAGDRGGSDGGPAW